MHFRVETLESDIRCGCPARPAARTRTLHPPPPLHAHPTCPPHTGCTAQDGAHQGRGAAQAAGRHPGPCGGARWGRSPANHPTNRWRRRRDPWAASHGRGALAKRGSPPVPGARAHAVHVRGERFADCPHRVHARHLLSFLRRLLCPHRGELRVTLCVRTPVPTRAPGRPATCVPGPRASARGGTGPPTASLRWRPPTWASCRASCWTKGRRMATACSCSVHRCVPRPRVLLHPSARPARFLWEQ